MADLATLSGARYVRATRLSRRTIDAVSAIIKVHIWACPECGNDEWWMKVPDEVARKRGVQRREQTPS